MGMNSGVSYMTMDQKTRRVNVPANEAVIGVENDVKSRRVGFSAPTTFDNVSMEGSSASVVYKTPDGTVRRYNAVDTETVGSSITFSWLMDKNVCATGGDVEFMLCLRVFSGTDVVREVNSAIGKLTVLPGLAEPAGSGSESGSEDSEADDGDDGETTWTEAVSIVEPGRIGVDVAMTCGTTALEVETTTGGTE